MKFAHNIFQGRAITMDCQDYITELVERKMGQHLQREERGAIQHLKNAGYTNRAIARAIGCSPTTVGNELKRGTPPRKSSKGRKPGYSARRGEAAYKARVYSSNSQRTQTADLFTLRCDIFPWNTSVFLQKMSCSTQKFLAAGHIGSWKNTP